MVTNKMEVKMKLSMIVVLLLYVVANAAPTVVQSCESSGNPGGIPFGFSSNVTAGTGTVVIGHVYRFNSVPSTENITISGSASIGDLSIDTAYNADSRAHAVVSFTVKTTGTCSMTVAHSNPWRACMSEVSGLDTNISTRCIARKMKTSSSALSALSDSITNSTPDVFFYGVMQTNGFSAVTVTAGGGYTLIKGFDGGAINTPGGESYYVGSGNSAALFNFSESMWCEVGVVAYAPSESCGPSGDIAYSSSAYTGYVGSIDTITPSSTGGDSVTSKRTLPSYMVLTKTGANAGRVIVSGVQAKYHKPVTDTFYLWSCGSKYDSAWFSFSGIKYKSTPTITYPTNGAVNVPLDTILHFTFE